MRPILLAPAAVAEIEEAFDWYEKQRPGLGAAFRTALRDCLARIGADPRQCQIVHRGTRRALLRRFPYGVFYREYPEMIVVIACMHARRDPTRWRSRV